MKKDDDARRSESWLETWRRRALTLPVLFAAGSAAVALLPLTTAAAVAAAPFERRRWAKLRCVGFFTSYLGGEMLFLTLAAGQWLLAPGWARAGGPRLERWNQWLGDRWGAWLHKSGILFFGLRFEVSGLEALERGGPLITFWRHASMGDTPLAPVFLGRHAGLRLRYIAKNELRTDPIFDVIGGRSRSRFVRRGSGQAEREIAAVVALLEGLGPRDAVVIFPEGTRFTADKRERVLEQARTRLDPELFARAQAMHNVLPPRLGGPVALLEHNPGADVLFCAHAGYEGVATFGDLLDGRGVGRRIAVRFVRVPFASVPHDREALAGWLFDQWLAVDQWIAAQLAPAAALSDAAPTRAPAPPTRAP